MKSAHLMEVRICGIDGRTRTFRQGDAELAKRILKELHPNTLLSQDRIRIPGDHSRAAFVPPLVTRVDLVTHDLSIWDFPFVLGAPVEITKEDFSAGLLDMEHLPKLGLPGDLPVFLDLEMVNGKHTFLCMQIVAGLFHARRRIYSLFKERKLVFGLREGGVGVLNLANLLRFTVHPEPREDPAASFANGRNPTRVKEEFAADSSVEFEARRKAALDTVR